MAEWQTRTVQVRMVAILCGFKSHFLHKVRAELRLWFRFFYIIESSFYDIKKLREDAHAEAKENVALQSFSGAEYSNTRILIMHIWRSLWALFCFHKKKQYGMIKKV